MKMETVLHSAKDKRSQIQQFIATNPKDAKLSLTYLTVSFTMLLIGGILGLLQGLVRAGLITMPPAFDYYQTLTAHGILLILVFTGTFLVGYVYAGTSHVLGGLRPGVRK